MARVPSRMPTVQADGVEVRQSSSLAKAAVPNYRPSVAAVMHTKSLHAPRKFGKTRHITLRLTLLAVFATTTASSLATKPSRGRLGAGTMPDDDDDDDGDLPEGVVQRRAAFDIGSGATKLMIADVDVETGRMGTVVYGQEHPVKFALDWKKNGHLSEDVQNEGLKVLHGLRTQCLTAGCTGYTAIATEVFRKAPNGAAFLARVRDEIGVSVSLVSQDEEAMLGFRTAVALSGRPAAETIAYDSGGGSFQISAPGAVDGAPDGAPLRMYVGALGASVATAQMVEVVQGATLATRPSPNPASADEAAQLVTYLKGELAPPPTWLRGAALVTSIGGPNSIFRLVEQVSAQLEPSTVATPPPRRFDVAAVRRALEARCGLSDAELAALGHSEVEMVVPKLCLLQSVLEACEIGAFEYVEAIGSCAGLLISNERFPDE